MTGVLSLGSDPGQIRVAREFCVRQLDQVLPTVDPAVRGGLIGDAATIASELVTNALRAGAGVIQISAEVAGDRFRISVYDDAPGLPAPVAFSQQATNGRGLHIIQALCARWGVTVGHDGTSKEVWAELALARDRQPTTATY